MSSASECAAIPDSRLALEIALGHPPAPRPERCGYHKLSEAQRRTQRSAEASLCRAARRLPIPAKACGGRWSIQIHRSPALSHRHRMQRREQHAVHT